MSKPLNYAGADLDRMEAGFKAIRAYLSLSVYRDDDYGVIAFGVSDAGTAVSVELRRQAPLGPEMFVTAHTLDGIEQVATSPEGLVGTSLDLAVTPADYIIAAEMFLRKVAAA